MSDAQGTTGIVLKRGNGGSPEVFSAVGEISGFDGPGGSANEIDVSHFTSSAKEYIIGLKDEGEITFDMNFVPTDPGQSGLWGDRDTRAKRNFTLTFSDLTHVMTFTAYVRTLRLTGRTDDAVRGALTLRITGAVGRNW